MSSREAFNNDKFKKLARDMSYKYNKPMKEIFEEISTKAKVTNDAIRKYCYFNTKPSSPEVVDIITNYFIENKMLPKDDKSLRYGKERSNSLLGGNDEMIVSLGEIEKELVKEVMDKWYLLYANVVPSYNQSLFEYYDYLCMQDEVDVDKLWDNFEDCMPGAVDRKKKYQELVVTLHKIEGFIPKGIYFKMTMLIKKFAFVYILDAEFTRAEELIFSEEFMLQDDYFKKLIADKRIPNPNGQSMFDDEIWSGIYECIGKDLKEIFIELLK